MLSDNALTSQEDTALSTPPSMQEIMARKIAGEIILSKESGVAMKKWRELFAVSQNRLSEKMLLSPSVISDYESGRRKKPGTLFVKRFVWALLAIDRERGGSFLQNEGLMLLREDYRVVRDYAKTLRLKKKVLAKYFHKERKLGKPIRAHAKIGA